VRSHLAPAANSRSLFVALQPRKGRGKNDNGKNNKKQKAKFAKRQRKASIAAASRASPIII
jgi:hypothetical protein